MRNSYFRAMNLYMLPLEDGCYYVGTTVNLNKRYSQHAAGTGAAWTKLHPPLGRELVQSWEIPNMSLFQVEQMEDVFTVAMQKKYGLNNVRGGYTVQTQMLKKRLPRHTLRNNYYNHKRGRAPIPERELEERPGYFEGKRWYDGEEVKPGTQEEAEWELAWGNLERIALP